MSRQNWQLLRTTPKESSEEIGQEPQPKGMRLESKMSRQNVKAKLAIAQNNTQGKFRGNWSGTSA